ncbi:hypothetical protein AMECASPLE_038539, partial [Ameca splendens]
MWEYLRREAEKSSRQAAEERKQRSPFWGTRLARPLPGTGPLRHRPSPHPQSKSLATVCFSSSFSEPELPAAHSPSSEPAPSRRRCRRRRKQSAAVAASELVMPSAVLQLPVQPPAPSRIEAGLEEIKRKLMRNRCCKFVLHLMDHPEDLDQVHSLLQAEFLAVGWLDAPAPLSAGGPFNPLLVAVKAAKPLDSQHLAKPLYSQHSATPTEPQPAA